MTVLRVDSSIQGPWSASTALADLVMSELTAVRPDVPVVSRHLAADPLPAEAWPTAISAGATAVDDRTPAQRAAVALAGELAEELRGAELAVLALPLYNWGVSQHVKAWIDLALAGGQQGEPLLEGTPTVLVTTRGGAYGPGTPKHGWDHNLDYLRRILADVWQADLTVVEREFTLVGVNPALDAFQEPAALMKKEAEESARAAGRALATRARR
ncbi:FMN-dependent NADH-azoreductase [Mumia quercus]|uniref:FMN-dependent NADH-azoreductase n=1 Tax=Mumia quercus TaxID=2976125 RepID=UPI0021D06400|nr:NAD(P)H-dependent oxidoreductase [Mumia quercus]